MPKEVGGVGMTACSPPVGQQAGRKGKDHNLTTKIGEFALLRYEKKLFMECA
jgi:hypothetical protein